MTKETKQRKNENKVANIDVKSIEEETVLIAFTSEAFSVGLVQIGEVHFLLVQRGKSGKIPENPTALLLANNVDVLMFPTFGLAFKRAVLEVEIWLGEKIHPKQFSMIAYDNDKIPLRDVDGKIVLSEEEQKRKRAKYKKLNDSGTLISMETIKGLIALKYDRNN